MYLPIVHICFRAGSIADYRLVAATDTPRFTEWFDFALFNLQHVLPWSCIEDDCRERLSIWAGFVFLTLKVLHYVRRMHIHIRYSTGFTPNKITCGWSHYFICVISEVIFRSRIIKRFCDVSCLVKGCCLNKFKSRRCGRRQK